jgi:hypothetical protein
MAGLNREIIDTEHYVARYVRDALRVDEREAFEEFCVLHPEIAEQVATDRVMLRGMQALEKEQQVDASSWTRYRLAASIAMVLAVVGVWGFLQFGAPAPNALFAIVDTVPARLESRLSAEPLRVVLQRGAPFRLQPAPGRDALRLDVVLDSADTSPQFTVALIEYTQHGEIERGRTTQTPRMIDDERILPVVIDLSAVEGRRLRLDVKSQSGKQQFELRVVHH